MISALSTSPAQESSGYVSVIEIDSVSKAAPRFIVKDAHKGCRDYVKGRCSGPEPAGLVYQSGEQSWRGLLSGCVCEGNDGHDPQVKVWAWLNELEAPKRTFARGALLALPAGAWAHGRGQRLGGFVS